MNILVILALVVTCFWMQQTDAFIPFPATNVYTVGTVTHAAITERAILQVAKEVLIENPNPDPDIDSTARIEVLPKLTPRRLIRAYYGDIATESYISSLQLSFDKAIFDTAIANAIVDLNEARLGAAHFDRELFQEGQNRLVELRQVVVAEIKQGQYEAARRQAGRMLHTLQDFYSHSNWIEIGNGAPYTVLGKEDQNPTNIAPPDMATCNNCAQGNGPVPGITPPAHLYDCKNNIRSEVINNGILTSGYYPGSMDKNRHVIDKPNGKCSHGGFLDTTRDQVAIGGINKDSLVAVWTYLTDLHVEAAQIAIEASAVILQEIRREVNNDVIFAAFINLELTERVVVASIAYVIDTTGTTGEELQEIQATLPKIDMMLEDYSDGRAEVKYILVPFNDTGSGLVYTTENISEFQNAIQTLHPDGGGDCSQPSVDAVIRATQASKTGSPIYVFTNADASDANRKTELQALIAQKGVSVTYVRTDACFERKRSARGQQSYQRKHRQSDNNLYEFIAAYSGGEVLNVATADISELSSVIALSAQSSYTNIVRKSGAGPFSATLQFPVDETLDVVVINLNGYGITASVRTPEGINSASLDPAIYQVELHSNTSYIATINVSDTSLYGVWQLDFNSSGSYVIQISVLTELTFVYLLFQFDPDGFSLVEGYPREGEDLILLVETSGESDDGTHFDEVTLLDAKGEEIQTYNLSATNNDTYGSIFVPPVALFQLQITGEDRKGNSIVRISSTGVQVSDVDLRLGPNFSHYNRLLPGDSLAIALVLYNLGGPDIFNLTIGVDNASAPFYQTISPTYVLLDRNETSEFIVTVTASENAIDGERILYTASVASTNDIEEKSDFTTFEVYASTIPPPSRCENIYATVTTDSAVKNGVSILFCILLSEMARLLVF